MILADFTIVFAFFSILLVLCKRALLFNNLPLLLNKRSFFPGAHTPTAEEVKTWYVPLVEKLMMEYPDSKDGYRYFGIDLDLSIHDGYNYMESINPYS